MKELLIRGRTFKRMVRIERWEDSQPLVFDDCKFQGGFAAPGARIDRGLSFIGCSFKPLKECAGCADVALDFSDACIQGDLVLFNCEIEGRFLADGLEAKDNIRLQGCRIASAGALGRPIEAAKVLVDDVDALLASQNWSVGDGDEVASLVMLDRATIGGNFEILFAGKEASRGAIIDQPEAGNAASVIAGSVSCDGIDVEGNVNFSDLIIFGPTTFNSSTVARDFSLHRASLRGSGGQNNVRLSLNRANISGNLELGYTDVKGETSLYGVAVGGNCDLLGLKCDGNLDLAFSTITYCTAYCTNEDTGTLNRRKTLHVGGHLWLSGAKIGMVELRAATIGGDVTARTGEFGIFILGLGVEPSGNAGKYWPVSCVASAVALTSVTVREELNMAGIEVIKAPLAKRYGLELLNCTIGGALVFFVGDKLIKELQFRWGTSLKWEKPKTEGAAADEPAISPKSNAFPSKISGDLIVRACRIGGDLDLRDVHVDPGGIFLNETHIGLGLKSGPESKFSALVKEVSDLATCCWYFDGEKLSCQGNADLSGIRVERKTIPGANGPPPSPERAELQAEADPPASDKRPDSISVVTFGEVGHVSLRGVHVNGDLVLARHPDPSSESQAPLRARIQGRLDLTSAHCERLVFSGKIFDPQEAIKRSALARLWAKVARAFRRGRRDNARPRAILARGDFSQVEILDWPGRPINLQQTTVRNWAFGPESEREFASKYVEILEEMNPEDRSIWLRVESELRNKSYEWQADRVYLAMVWSSKRRARSKWFFLRLPIFFWHLLSYFILGGFLFVKSFFVVPLVFSCLTLFWLSCLFSNPQNVRASVGLLDALPDETRSAYKSVEIHPSDLTGQISEWGCSDAVALALRYHIPLFESRTHDRWEASGNRLQVGFGKMSRTIRMETIAFAIEVIYWIALPMLLLGFVAWAFRKRETE